MVYDPSEVEEATLEYFNDDKLATNVWKTKYALKNKKGEFLEKTPDDMHKRLAKEFARMEKHFGEGLSEEKIYSYLKNFKYIVPQGSPMYGIGNNHVNVSLSNCVVVDSPKDSISSIVDSGKDLANLFKRRCGVGIDISTLRPDSMTVNNSAGTTSGAWSFADFYSYVCRMIGQNGRRGALMISMDVKHPDIEKFVTMKNDLSKVTGANVSVKITDDFMQAVEKEEEFDLQFPVNSDNPTFTKTIKAKDLWNLIVESATQNAEPGILMWDNITKNLPAHCYDNFKTISTNPSLREDTLVTTNLGAKPIKWLAENAPYCMVKNIDGEWKECKVFKSGKNKQLYKITTYNGQEIYCTKEHKWPILSTSNKVRKGKNKKLTKVETQFLKRQQKIVFPYDKVGIDNKESDFSYEDGFVLGWNVGDGWTSYHKNNKSNQLGFIFSEEDIDSGIGKLVLNYTNNLALRESSLRRDHNTKSFSYCTTDKRVVNKFYREFKVQNKRLGIPASIWEGNEQFVKGFIDGIFSSDGNVYVDSKKTSLNSINLISTHINLLKDVQKVLAFYGIRCSVSSAEKFSKFPNGKSGIYTRCSLKISGLHAKKFAETFKLTNCKKQESLDNLRNADYSQYKNTREYLTIKSIEPTDFYEDVYDITVFDNTHTFMTEFGQTSNCGEIPLSPYDSCRLISLNLKNLVLNPFKSNAKFDFKKLEEVVRVGMRLSDDLVELEIEKLSNILDNVVDENDEKELWQKLLTAARTGRRTGLGTHGLADALACLGLPYDSQEALEVVDKIYNTIKTYAYGESIELARQRGKFPDFDWQKEKENEYIKRLPKDIQEKMSKHGRRNISILTNAPTGSVSIESQTSSGLEPVFRNYYVRRRKLSHNEVDVEADFVDELGDRWQEYLVFHHNVLQWLKKNSYEGLNEDKLSSILPKYFTTSDAIDWSKRVEIQATIQKHIDHSISSTINLPKGTLPELVGKLYFEGWKKGLKGITVYVDGSRSGVLVEKNEKKNEDSFPQTNAPKRPELVDCDIHHIQVKGEKWTILIGLMNGKPYECLGGLATHIEIPKKFKKGKLKKNKFKTKNNIYDLIIGEGDDEFKIKDVVTMFDNPDFAVITRMISLGLRHGAGINYVVEQLQKDKNADMFSFIKCISRVLKTYIKDGTKVSGGTDKVCPDCQKDTLVYREGCKMCESCGWTACM